MPYGFQIPTDQPFDVDTFNRTLSTLIQMRRQQEESEAAANRYLGQQQYRQLIETGTQPEEALRKTAHLLFYDQPSALPGLMRVTAPRPEGFWTETPEGVPVWQTGRGTIQRAPVAAPTGAARTIRQLTAAEETQRRDLDRQLKAAENNLEQWEEVPPANRTPDVLKNIEAYRKETDTIRQQIQQLLSGEATGATAKTEKKSLTPALAKQFLAQAGGDKTKARQLARDAGYEF